MQKRQNPPSGGKKGTDFTSIFVLFYLFFLAHCFTMLMSAAALLSPVTNNSFCENLDSGPSSLGRFFNSVVAERVELHGGFVYFRLM